MKERLTAALSISQIFGSEEQGAHDVCPLKKPPEVAERMTSLNFPAATGDAALLDRREFRDVGQPMTSTMLLAVSACREDHVFLKQAFRDTTWDVCEAHAYREAMMILCHDRMPVIICE